MLDLSIRRVPYPSQIADSKLAQFAYLVGCPRSGEAIVIDPERDVDRYFDEAARHKLRIVAAVDTHIHADYLSGLREMAERGVLVYASKEGGTTGSMDGSSTPITTIGSLHMGTASPSDSSSSRPSTPRDTPPNI
jgi:glyoxylase-like metal-dependent hydrolase (beta-lactamase superfamily II)